MPNLESTETGAASSPLHYAVFLGDRVEHGSAEEILRGIRDRAPADSSLRGMDLLEYAVVLIKDADYFIPAAALEFLQKQIYPTVYDQALVYLAQMQASHIRILSKEAA